MEFMYDVVNERGHGSGQIFASHWLREDREAFAAWLGQQEAGKQRDNYLGDAVFRVTGSRDGDYAAGIEFAELLSDDRRRGGSIARTLESWHKAEPEALEEFIAGGTASEQTVEIFRQQQQIWPGKPTEVTIILYER